MGINNPYLRTIFCISFCSNEIISSGHIACNTFAMPKWKYFEGLYIRCFGEDVDDNGDGGLKRRKTNLMQELEYEVEYEVNRLRECRISARKNKYILLAMKWV